MQLLPYLHKLDFHSSAKLDLTFKGLLKFIVIALYRYYFRAVPEARSFSLRIIIYYLNIFQLVRFVVQI